MTSICDERGQELIYAGMPISEVLSKDVGIGGVISLLWFQRCLPSYVCKFFEMCLMVTADHGPAVSGAHNTIVCARAGKDLVSSVVSGLLTIVSYLNDLFNHYNRNTSYDLSYRAIASEVLWTDLPVSSQRRTTPTCIPWSS